jgi:hypothetical protein
LPDLFRQSIYSRLAGYEDTNDAERLAEDPTFRMLASRERRETPRLSCHRFRANEVRLLLAVIAYNLGNLLRRLVPPVAIQSWSLTSLQRRLLKTGGRLIRHARYFILQLAESQLAESQLTQRLFAQIIRRIERLTWHPT